MTLNTTDSKITYAGDGSSTAFAVPFKFLDNDDIEAVLRDDATGVEALWIENTEYTLAGAGSDAGGTLTVATSPADCTPQSGTTLVIRRGTSETQGSSFPAGGAFPSVTIETALDRLTMLLQQHSEAIARALLVPATDPEDSVGKLPVSVVRASKYLGFDASGKPIAASLPEGNHLISAFIETLLDDGDAATARETLGATVPADILTTRGDVIVQGAATPQRLALGAAGRFLRSDGTDPYWADAPQLYRDVTVVSANTTLGASHDGHLLVLDATGGNLTLTLPASPTDGMIFGLVKYDASASYVDINGNGNTVGEGISPLCLMQRQDFLTLIYSQAEDIWIVAADRRRFVSAEQTITAAGLLTLAHSLGVKPRNIRFELVCKTAELNYSVNDVLMIDRCGTEFCGSSRGMSVVADTANIVVRFGSSASTFNIINKTSGATSAITNANWKLVVRAEA